MFYCSACGNEYKKWYGKCPACKEYNTFAEVKTMTKVSNKNSKVKTNSFNSDIEITKLKDINIIEENRYKTNISEFDRVVGGGVVPGSLILIGGNPGIGKSTLTLQVTSVLANIDKLLYVSGEESTSQIKMRADRLKLNLNDNLLIANINNIDEIFSVALKNNIKFLVIDSIQTIYSEDNTSSAGSTAQVKECTLQLMSFAKLNNITIFIIGHVTKEGEIAGPKVLEHMVDTVLYLEGEKNTGYKILRSQKNRFGKVGEIGIFEMKKEGLFSVDNPDNFFISTTTNISGTSIGSIIEGERILFVEVQTLLINTEFGYPKRTTQGYDLQRLNLLLGVAQKRLNISFNMYDCYLNLANGLKTKDVSLDLAIIVSLISAHKDFKVSNKDIFLGEVSLTGEIRPVYRQEDIIEQAKKMGFTNIYANNKDKLSGVTHIDNIKDLLKIII